MRIVLLTHYFPPEVGAPQTRLAELAAGLVSRGHEVTVHTAPPHYPEGVIRAPYRNRPLASERLVSGVRVLRSAVYATPNRGRVRRVLNHLSHAVTSLATSPASGPCDVVVAETPPLFTAAAGAIYARAKGAPLLLHVADLWPESAVELGVLTDPRLVAAADGLARWCYRRSTGIAVPTEGMRSRLGDFAEAHGKVTRIAPAVALERFTPAPLPGGGPLRIAYAGTLGLSHGIEVLVRAAALAGPETVEVTLAGDGAEADHARAAIARHGAGNVHMAGSVPRDAVPGLYAAHHAGAVVLRDRPIFAAALPSKLFEVMAAGRAAVVSARGDAAELVTRAAAGVAVAPEDPVALAGALSSLSADRRRLESLGAAGRAYVAAHHDREAMVDAWDSLVRQSGRSAKRQAARVILDR